MRDLAQAQAAAYQPQYRLPASAEVQAHAVAQGSSAYVTEASLRSALEGLVIQVAADVSIDRQMAGRTVQVGLKQIRQKA